MSKKLKKNGKNCHINDKFRDVQILQRHSITSRNHTVNYSQALEEILWLLRLKKPKRKKIFKRKPEKKQVLLKKNC